MDFRSKVLEDRQQSSLGFNPSKGFRWISGLFGLKILKHFLVSIPQRDLDGFQVPQLSSCSPSPFVSIPQRDLDGFQVIQWEKV